MTTAQTTVNRQHGLVLTVLVVILLLGLPIAVGSTSRVAGVDLSAAMIEAARHTAAASGRAIELQAASIYELPFADGAFDAVRAERVLQHLDHPDAALREMMRVTKPGGRVLASDPGHGQAGLALDDPADRRVYEALQRAMTRMIMNLHSGTRLRGMFVREELSDVAQLIESFAFDHPQFIQMFFVSERLAAATAAGEITAQEGDSFLAAIEERHRAGTSSPVPSATRSSARSGNAGNIAQVVRATRRPLRSARASCRRRRSAAART